MVQKLLNWSTAMCMLITITVTVIVNTSLYFIFDTLHFVLLRNDNKGQQPN